MVDFNDRRPTRPTLFDPKPYFTKGGQGKLFKDPKPVDSARYPRGYSPERMNEVRNAPLHITHIGNDDAPFGGPGGERRVHEVVARSTTPMSELAPREEDDGLTIHTGADLNAAGDYSRQYWGQGRVRIGTHRPSTYSKGKGWGRADLHTSEEEGGKTLMHELGHAQSAMAYTKSSYYDTPTQRGKEEALADDNEVKRFRPDPRDVRAGRSKPVAPVYEHEQAHQGIGGARSHAAYLKARTTPIVQRARANAFKDQGHQPALPGLNKTQFPGRERYNSG